MSSWKDSLLLGVSLLDEQHHKLVELLDKLLEACKHGKGQVEIGQILNNTISYTKEHFTDEENLQERYSYPGINAHKRLHAQYIMKMKVLVQEYDKTGPSESLAGKLDKTLVEWIIDHINLEDRKLGAYILQAGGK